MTYWIVSAFCVIGLIIGATSIKQNDLLEEETEKMFLGVANLLIFNIILDTIAFFLDGKITESITVYKGIKIIEFITVPILPVLCTKIIARRSWWRKVCYIFDAVIGINAILQVFTFFAPLMFRITTDRTYMRTLFGYSYLVVISVCMVLFVISSKHTYIQVSPSISWLIFAMMGMVVMGIITRIQVEKCNSDFLALTIVYLLIFIYFCNNYLRIDPTTKLLNRKTFDNKMISTHYTTAIIFIDANRFKHINDEYGHARGDWALARISEAILEVFKEVGMCYRLGGDEFVVVLNPNVIQRKTCQTKNSDRYQVVEDLILELDKKLAQWAKKDDMLKYGVSEGYGIHYSRKDTSAIDKYKPMTEVLKIAEEDMYEDKKKKDAKWDKR